jgi:hypothetical protein
MFSEYAILYAHNIGGDPALGAPIARESAMDDRWHFKAGLLVPVCGTGQSSICVSRTIGC